jgi:hypothetical protein
MEEKKSEHNQQQPPPLGRTPKTAPQESTAVWQGQQAVAVPSSIIWAACKTAYLVVYSLNGAPHFQN